MKFKKALIIAVAFCAFLGSACNAGKIELPIDNAKKAIIIAKQDKDVKKFIRRWSDEFRIGFDAQFLPDEETWLVRVFVKGDIKDVEYHIIIKPDGKILNKYYPPF